MSALKSGLGTMRRDWRENESPSSSPEEQTTKSSTSSKTPSSSQSVDISDRAKRLAAITAALSGGETKASVTASSTSASKRPVLEPVPLMNIGTRRPSPANLFNDIIDIADLDDDFSAEPAAKKKRVLPSSFTEPMAPSASSSSSFNSGKPSGSSTGMKVLSVTRAPKAEKPASLKKAATIFLSKEQTKILDLVKNGCSVFYTGSAGTGKSVLLREMIRELRKKYTSIPDAVAITASTGIAACNIGGVTIHSYAGIGLGIESVEHLCSKIRKNKKASARWARTKVLIIDEVSMVDGDLFDKLARIAKNLRRTDKPFGGIQLIVTGDFFQLPPVAKGGDPKFAFEAQLWGESIQHTFNLTKVFRQTDQEFVDMLNEMRFGRLSSSSIRKFSSLSREIKYEDGMMATELFPRRNDVDRSNETRMRSLNTESHTYRATDAGTITDPQQREKMLQNFMAPGLLELKVDSQVMLIKNTDEQLVNGSIGRVLRFSDGTEYKDESDGTSNKRKKVASGPVYPIVEFIVPGGAMMEVMITPETFKVELPNGEVQVSRTQLPLIVSWAMSIHKSQGQTLSRVKVDLQKVFEKGQAYVALSRATSLEGLQVLHFDASKVQAHPKVIEWSKTLKTIKD